MTEICLSPDGYAAQRMPAQLLGRPLEKRWVCFGWPQESTTVWTLTDTEVADWPVIYSDERDVPWRR